jgi:hypothetical protein
MVVLRRQGNTLQLLARNTKIKAPQGTPLARAVNESYSDSLLAAVPLAAAPHAERKSLLVDAYALLGGDINGVQTAIEASYRMPYGLDRANSNIERTRAAAEGTHITVRSHYAVPKLPAPPVMIPGAPPPPPGAMPNPPMGVPDGRSFFLSTTYTLAPLPAQPARTRAADQRVTEANRMAARAEADCSIAGGRVEAAGLAVARYRSEVAEAMAALEVARAMLDVTQATLGWLGTHAAWVVWLLWGAGALLTVGTAAVLSLIVMLVAKVGAPQRVPPVGPGAPPGAQA